MDRILFYVLYALMVAYIAARLYMNRPYKLEMKEPAFKFIAFILLYFVAQVDLVLGILLLVVLILDMENFGRESISGWKHSRH